MFYKVMVIRGIGYRAFYIKNDFVSTAQDSIKIPARTVFTDHILPEESEEEYEYWNELINEFNYSRYLIIRAGHTSDLYLPLNNCTEIRIFKKERKLVVYGTDKQIIHDLAKAVYDYRRPSAYTGRGVRRKKVKVVRKAGKRDTKGR